MLRKSRQTRGADLCNMEAEIIPNTILGILGLLAAIVLYFCTKARF